MLIFLSSLNLRGASPDLYLSFEDIADGTSDSSIDLSLVIKTNGTVISGRSFVGSAGKVSIQTGGLGDNLHRPLVIGSSSYTNTTKHLLCKSDNTVSTLQCIEMNLIAHTKKFSYGFSITLSNFTGTGSFYDAFGVFTSTDQHFLSIVNNNPPFFQLEGNTSPYGQDINVANNITFWVTGIWDSAQASANDRNRMYIYNQTNMVLVGFSIDANVTQNATVDTVHYGIADEHSKDSGTSYRLGNFIAYTNGTVFPVWPGSNLQFPTNFSPSGMTKAIGDATAGDWIMMPGTNATFTSGFTFNKNNSILTSVIRTGKGTNETKIIADGVFDCITASGSLCVVSNFQISGDGINDEATGIVQSGAHNRFSNLLLQELDFAFFAQNNGLIYDSYFLNNHYAGGRNIFGSSYYDNNYPLSNDSTNVFVWEDCHFNWDSGKNSSSDAPIMSSQEGQAFTVRYCDGKFDKLLAAIAPAIDVHGDWDPGPDAFYRPAVLVQVYKNDFTNINSDISGQKFVDVRGGTVLVYSNKWTGATYDANQGIFTREEHPEDTSPYYATNCIYFENYDNGGSHAMAINDDGNCTNGRNYTNVAPAILVALEYPHPMRRTLVTPPSNLRYGGPLILKVVK